MSEVKLIQLSLPVIPGVNAQPCQTLIGKPCCCKSTNDSLTLPEANSNEESDNKSCCSIKETHTEKPSTTKYSIAEYLPLEKAIRDKVNLKKWFGISDSTSRTLKELLMAFTNFVPAIGLSKILASFHISPFLVTPTALSSMHFLNQGNEKKDRLLLNSASALGILSANQFFNLPRAFVRPIMAFCVLFVETKWPLLKALIKLKAEGNEEKLKKIKIKPEHIIRKDDFLRLVRLEALVNSIPKITKFYSKYLDEMWGNRNPINRIFAKVGIFTLEILGLSSGFVLGGKGIDYAFEKLKLTENIGYLSTRASNVMILSCCPAEGSAEAIAEASAVSAT